MVANPLLPPIFQSTLPARGATPFFRQKSPIFPISIHAPRTGSDRAVKRGRSSGTFQSTLPARGATGGGSSLPIMDFVFQSTLPARGATDGDNLGKHRIGYFNPRSPHGERRGVCDLLVAHAIFQSTLPARGATVPDDGGKSSRTISIHAPRTGSDSLLHVEVKRDSWISIHAPRTGSDPRGYFGVTWFEISIHAPRTGSDAHAANITTLTAIFQSTLPARGATSGTGGIHQSCGYFNPRSPHGERQSGIRKSRRNEAFQSTLPARGATVRFAFFNSAIQISIHAPRTGSDLIRHRQHIATYTISIHAPRTGSDERKGRGSKEP